MKKFNLTLIVAAMLLTACTRDFDKFDVRNPIPAEDANSINFTIPIEEAIEELNSVLDAIDEQQMAAGGGAMVMAMNNRRQIDKVSVVYSNMPILQKESTTSPTGMQKAPATTYKDSLLYVVDFKDNKGCAVLAADRRIPETVLAITETGSFNNMDSNMFPPTYKQGMYSDSELMKGFSLYNAEVDDYYVASDFINPLTFCKDYANFHIQLVHKEFNPLPKGSYLERGKWKIIEKIAPMLITIWHQDSPFNDEAPYLSWFPWQEPKRSPAGCFPIAIAQIIAYHEKISVINGYILDWKNIKKNLCVYNKSDNKGVTHENLRGIAYLLQYLSVSCRAIHTPEFTFVLPCNARKTMARIYGNATTHCSYNNGVVYNMLNNNKPVLVCAVSDCVDGHAWVVDGYLHRKRKMREVQLGEGGLPSSVVSEYEDEQTLVHCNWGWTGRCNGYYLQGIFDLRDGPIEYENSIGENDTTYKKSYNKSYEYFKKFIYTITYSE